MKFFNPDRKSIAFRLTALTITIIIGQAALLSFFIIVGGVMSQAEQNAFSSFAEKVRNRKDYLQREMKIQWMNMDPYVEKISERYEDEEETDQFFADISDPMISMLRATKVTGVFVIMADHSEEDKKAALYIRDYDPALNDYNDRDLYYVFGPSSLANKLQIPLDRIWSYRMDLSIMNPDFYEKPLSKASLSPAANLLGYWSLPFCISPEDAPVITYSMPLFDKSNQLIGIVGIEVSEQYLSKFLPATDLQIKDSYGYMLGYRQGGEQEIKPIVFTRAIQKRIAKIGQPLEYTHMGQENSVYVLDHNEMKGNIYLSIESLGLYSNNTPFQQSQWYLIGIMGENNLLSYVLKIKYILVVSLAASVMIGVIFGYIVSHRFTRPIIEVSQKVKSTNTVKEIVLENTGLKEVDELLKAIQTTSNMLLEASGKMSKIIEMVGIPLGVFEYADKDDKVFFTDQLPKLLALDARETEKIIDNKALFIDILQKFLNRPEEEEEDIYSSGQGPDKWLKIKLTEKDHVTIGVIMDATDEMIEKKKIMTDRDIDPLTGIYNRKAMQLHMEEVLSKRDRSLVSAILMFDLDNLKMVNDMFGHKWGDLYINHAVEHLVEIPGERKVLGRRSGDEFALLLVDYGSKEQMRASVDEFYRKLREKPLAFPSGLMKAVGISAGLVWIGDQDFILDEYLNQADMFLYEAKREGKGYYCEGRMG